jgi:molybdopterin converting factor small subunit
MDMQNQNDQNETEKKTVIYLTTGEVVDLLIEWAETAKLPEWLDKMMEDIQAKSFTNKLTEEDEINFITAFAYYMPHDSPLKELVLRFLRSYNADWVICEGNF